MADWIVVVGVGKCDKIDSNAHTVDDYLTVKRSMSIMTSNDM